MAYPTPADAFSTAIAQWEGLWSDDPGDTGNYANGRNGTRKLIGSMRGVTPDVYATHLGIDPGTLTAAKMRAQITLSVAAQIAVTQFYEAPGFNLLPWSPLVAIALDAGWMSGASRGVKLLQQLVGADIDGDIGPQTAAMVTQYLGANSIDLACDALTQTRVEYFASISEPGTTDAKFRNGWTNRANWFLSTNQPRRAGGMPGPTGRCLPRHRDAITCPTSPPPTPPAPPGRPTPRTPPGARNRASRPAMPDRTGWPGGNTTRSAPAADAGRAPPPGPPSRARSRPAQTHGHSPATRPAEPAAAAPPSPPTSPVHPNPAPCRKPASPKAAPLARAGPAAHTAVPSSIIIRPTMGCICMCLCALA